jgi:hypothetical protein
MNCEMLQAVYLAEGPTESWGKHVGSCDACRAAQPELNALRSTLASSELWELPSDSVEDAILAAVSSPAKSTDQPRVSKRRRWFAAASIAAILAIGVAASALLRDPADWSVELMAAASFDGAAAVVDGWNTDTGTRMEVAVTGIPPVGGAGYYEIWMTAPDGGTVSAGTFRSSGAISVWSGVTRRAYPRIWVTFETDGDPAPTGAVVFDTVPAQQ